MNRALAGNFVFTVNFYDKYGRVVQTTQTRQVDASNQATIRVSSKINLLGEVLQTKTTQTVGAVATVIDDFFTLDHRGRLLASEKRVNGEKKASVKESYNELGQLLSEKSGADGDNYLQNTDYLYNIRGWLRGLNNTPEESDLFAMQLYYNERLDSLVGTDQYNGNISAMKWTNRSLGNTLWKAYGFEYDELNRLNEAVYGEYSQAGSNINAGFYNDERKDRFNEYGITYDLNGNIQTLNRRGINNPSAPSVSYSEVDQLDYDYLGNKLIKVDDYYVPVTGRGDFSEKVKTTTEYLYDANGNMYKDDNKGITNISYNFLNLPQQVNFSASNDYITYTFDASGSKLSKKVVKGGSVAYTENYLGAFVYKTTGTSAFAPANDLKYIITEKGRLVSNAGTLTHEYFLKDHLGNTRVVFTDVNGSGTIENNSTEILEYADYYPFGMLHSRASTLADATDNRLLYNGKELQAETFSTDGNAGDEVMFDWYDYGARFYDPQIGRWHSVDPSAERRIEYTPYAYVLDNPILRLDPNGLTDFKFDDETGEVTQVGDKNDEPDRIVKTYVMGKNKGEVKTYKHGKKEGQNKAVYGLDNIEKGILSDGMNFKTDDNIIQIGGEGQASEAGVKSFTLKLSEYVGREIKGFSYSSDASGNITDMVLGKYIYNTLTESYGTPNELAKKYGVNYSNNNVLQQFHTHPDGELGATGSNPELSTDVAKLQSDKPKIPNATFIILYRITGQETPAEYPYTRYYRPKK